MPPILGGIKLDAKCMVNLKDFPCSSALFGLVIKRPLFFQKILP